MGISGAAGGDGHVLGNFHAYYSFNPVGERLRFMNATTSSALRAALLAPGPNERADAPATVLDIGCNEGDLTLGLYAGLIGRESGAEAVDVVTFDNTSVSQLNEYAQKQNCKIDYVFLEDGGSEHRKHYVCELRVDGQLMSSTEGVSKRVAKAKAAGLALASLQSAVDAGETATPKSEDMPRDTPKHKLVTNRRPLHVLGVDVDEELIKRATTKTTPVMTNDQIEFVHADVMNVDYKNKIAAFLDRAGRSQGSTKRPFDLVTMFSVTMWIHLNHGDDGLWRCLDKVAESTEHLIVEPQPWKCYRNAIKRLNRLRVAIPPSFTGLKVREEVVERIDAFLLDTGRFQYKSEIGKTNWSRPIVLYSRRPIPGIEYAAAK